MTKAIYIKRQSQVLRIYCINDTHTGAVSSREKEQAKLAALIADDSDGVILGLGDYTESIALSDKRFDPSELLRPISPEHISNPFYQQALRFCKIWEPTRGKWIALIPGNHELTALKRYHIDPAAIIAERMGAPYVGGTAMSAWLRISMRESGGSSSGKVDIFGAHGWGAGELRGGDALKLQRLLWRKAAAVVIIAHTHRGMVFPETVEFINGSGHECEETRWGVISPALVGKHNYLASHGGNAPSPCYAVITLERCRAGPPRISAELRSI